MEAVTKYISERILQINKLIDAEPEGSIHIYPLQAAQYELLLLAKTLGIIRS